MYLYIYFLKYNFTFENRKRTNPQKSNRKVVRDYCIIKVCCGDMKVGPDFINDKDVQSTEKLLACIIHYKSEVRNFKRKQPMLKVGFKMNIYSFNRREQNNLKSTLFKVYTDILPI